MSEEEKKIVVCFNDCIELPTDENNTIIINEFVIDTAGVNLMCMRKDGLQSLREERTAWRNFKSLPSLKRAWRALRGQFE